jgi:hypothetical protein
MLPSSITRDRRLDKPLGRKGRHASGKPSESFHSSSPRFTLHSSVLGVANSAPQRSRSNLRIMQSDREGRGCLFVLSMGILASFGTAVVLYSIVFVAEQGFGLHISLDWALGFVVWPSLAAGPLVMWLLGRGSGRE